MQLFICKEREEFFEHYQRRERDLNIDVLTRNIDKSKLNIDYIVLLICKEREEISEHYQRLEKEAEI